MSSSSESLRARQAALLRMDQELDTDALFTYADACLDENPRNADPHNDVATTTLPQQRKSNEERQLLPRTEDTHPSSPKIHIPQPLAFSGVPAVSSPSASPSENSSTSEVGLAAMGDDAALRFQRAKLAVLQKQVEHFTAEAQDLDSQLRASETARKREADEHRRQARTSAALKEKLDKEISLRTGAEEESERLRTEVASLRRELDESRRVVRSADSESRSHGVRLNRALEDVKKYKDLLALEREKKAEDGDSGRQQLARAEARAAKLEKQKAELLGAFKKQMKLIDVLKRQKVHIEAARALAFTEEEFIKTLDWGSV